MFSLKKNSSGVLLSRMRLFYICVFLVVIFIISQLFIIQIIHGDEYYVKSNRQYVVSFSSIFNRGNIFFTEYGGERVSAGTLRTGFTIAINPSRIVDATSVFNELSNLVTIDSNSFFIRASKKDDPYEEIIKRVDKTTAKRIKKLNIDGVIVSEDRWRFYPAEDMAAHVLGFVGYRGDDIVGRYGLERYYDDVLKRGEEDLYVNFFAEVFSNIGKSIFKGKNHEGDIITSIELSVQGVLEDKLKEIMDKWDTDSVGGIIIDPQTGKIYAMASLPTFNPNKFNTTPNISVFQNPIVESVFEMGSIIKPITLAIGLDTEVITSDTKYVDNGYVLIDGYRIKNFDGKARGEVLVQEVLNQSLNTGAVFVMKRIGKENFRRYMLALGLGEETGIDLPGEVAGLVDNLNSTREIEYATASFGQGIATTPIATVKALSSLANGGVLITPYIVNEIDYKSGFSRNIIPGNSERVFKKETSEEITRMLVSVVDDTFMGGKAKIPNYSVAAKTGTAQIARESGRGYDDNKFLHSFFGYFPAYDPRFLVFLYTINPTARYASQTLMSPFMDITKFLLSYYEVPPDR